MDRSSQSISSRPVSPSPTDVHGPLLSSPVVRDNVLSTARGPASGPIRNKKGRKGKEKAGTKRGASSFKQGTSFVQQSSDISTLAERQNLCQVGNGIILTVAAVARDNLSMASPAAGDFTRVDALLHRISRGVMNPQPNPNNFDIPWKNLGMMAKACHESEMLDAVVQLTYWINTIQFASQVLW